MLPVPRHLTKIFQADIENCNEFDLEGSICCDCSCKLFFMKVFADFDSNNIPHVCKYKDDWALVIKAVCKSCGKEWLLFDMSQHGYNGYVCHDGITVPDSELKSITCPICYDNIFKINVNIEIEDKEQFLEDVIQYEPDKFSEEDYIDAFNGIGIDIYCVNCGKLYKGWIAFGTS